MHMMTWPILVTITPDVLHGFPGQAQVAAWERERWRARVRAWAKWVVFWLLGRGQPFPGANESWAEMALSHNFIFCFSRNHLDAYLINLN
jgi:hypothetical protein